MQASRFERFSFDPFSLFWNGFVTPEVDFGRVDVVDALVAALMIVVVDEVFDLSFEITRQGVVFEQDAVLQGLMPPFDLALGILDLISQFKQLFHFYRYQKTTSSLTGKL